MSSYVVISFQAMVGYELLEPPSGEHAEYVIPTLHGLQTGKTKSSCGVSATQTHDALHLSAFYSRRHRCHFSDCGGLQLKGQILTP
jgi:hypothetical protein